MHCSCIRGRYDFHVTAYKEAIIYQDFSEWIVDDTHSFPESYTIEVTLPESNKGIRLEVGVNHVIYPEDLGLTCIKDGIYCFTVVDCGSKTFTGCCGVIYKQSRLIAPKTRCCIDDSYATLDRYNETKDIEEMFEQAKISIELNQVKKARKQFEYVQKKLKYINCNC